MLLEAEERENPKTNPKLRFHYHTCSLSRFLFSSSLPAFLFLNPLQFHYHTSTDDSWSLECSIRQTTEYRQTTESSLRRFEPSTVRRPTLPLPLRFELCSAFASTLRQPSGLFLFTAFIILNL